MAVMIAALAAAPPAEAAIYFERGGSVYVARDDGSKPRELGIKVPWTPTGRAVSPDGRYLLFDDLRRGKLWLKLLRIRDRRVVARRLGQCREPAWSPGSTRVACLAGRASSRITELIVRSVPSLRLRTVAPKRLDGYDFVFSPDGSQLAWSVVRSIFRAPAQGGPETFVFRGPSETRIGAWGPPGIALTFVVGATVEVFLVQPDGSGLRRVTRSPDLSAWYVRAFSRDGSRLLVNYNEARDVPPPPPKEPHTEEPPADSPPPGARAAQDDLVELRGLDPATGAAKTLFRGQTTPDSLLSRDGRRVLATADDVVHLISYDTGKARRIARGRHIGWTQ